MKNEITKTVFILVIGCGFILYSIISIIDYNKTKSGKTETIQTSSSIENQKTVVNYNTDSGIGISTYSSSGMSLYSATDYGTNSLTAKANYNIEKDSLIQNVLNSKLISKNKYGNYFYDEFTFTYHPLQIKVIHQRKIPYEQEENWIFWCNDKEGKSILIQSSMGVIEHTISNHTLERIKIMCLNF